MTFARVSYSAHASDGDIQIVINRLRGALEASLSAHGVETPISDHLEHLPVVGCEPACAQVNSVALFSLEEKPGFAYPSRFFRVIDQPVVRARFYEFIPTWALSTRLIIAFNPDADTSRIDQATRKNCFDSALLNLHARFGGFRPPKRKREKYATGYRARKTRDDIVSSC